MSSPDFINFCNIFSVHTLTPAIPLSQTQKRGMTGNAYALLLLGARVRVVRISIFILLFRQLKCLHSFLLFRMSSPLSALTRHLRFAALRCAPCPPEGASISKYYGYIPAPFGGRMSEGQEGGLFSLIADVKYLIAVVIILQED